jgi:hypothetical protein
MTQATSSDASENNITPETTLSSRELGVQETGTYRANEYDLPESTASILLLAGMLAVVLGVAIRTSLRDSRFLSTPWRAALLLPRLAVLAVLFIILLNPRQRTQLSRIERSRAGLLIDTSLSMTYAAADSESTTPAEQKDPQTAAATPFQSRSDAVVDALIGSDLLQTLSKSHEVSVYTFDSVLRGPAAIVHNDTIRFLNQPNQDAEPENNAAVSGTSADPSGSSEPTDTFLPQKLSDADSKAKLRELLQPSGSETRLSECLHQLVGQLQGRTLSGLVVISDGQSNAGIESSATRIRAERTGTRIITAGTGNQKPQRNLWIAGMQSPEDVHKGDPFDLSVLVQGSTAAEQTAVAELYEQSAGGNGNDRRKVNEVILQMKADGIPVTATFHLQHSVPGTYEYIATVRFAESEIREMTLADNERHREIEVTDRRLRVLLISSGPMRDYQFVRNIMFRHSGIESDVWLQTVTPESAEFVSQEAKTLLLRFPETEAALFQYDVIVAFDPDWSKLSVNEQQYLNRWVSEHSGGLIIVAGEIFTPRLALESDAFREIQVLYPVILNRTLPDLQIAQRADQPWPLLLTREGMASDFLKIADAAGIASLDLWKTFRGVYRSYPVRSLRDGAVSLLEYANPRAETEIGRPPFLASQFYGTGRTLFLGSAETWRLRELSPQGHQQLWTSLIREAGQGRRNRGTARGRLMLDRSEAVPGQAVNIRAQLYDAQLQPLKSQTVPVSIIESDGSTMKVPSELYADGRGTGQFVNNFRPSRPGRYRVSLQVPESSDVLQSAVEVVVPNLESLNATQNVALLKELTENTDGTFLPLSELSQKLPGLLPDRSEPVIIDEQLKTLWDRSSCMYLMILLLAVEWTLRRVVRLS